MPRLVLSLVMLILLLASGAPSGWAQSADKIPIPETFSDFEQQAEDMEAADEELQLVKDFNLLVNCEPVWVLVPNPQRSNSSMAKRLGLTESLLQTRAETRLQKAKIFGRPGHLLLLRMRVIGPVMHVELSFHKTLYDVYSQSEQIAVTWENGMTGAHGNDRAYILRHVDSLVDQFIAAYYAVNRKACA